MTDRLCPPDRQLELGERLRSATGSTSPPPASRRSAKRHRMTMFDELRLVRPLTYEQIVGDPRLVGTSRTG